MRAKHCVCPAKRKEAERKRNDNTKSKAGRQALSYHANSKPRVSISIGRRICVIPECWNTFGIDYNLWIMAMGASESRWKELDQASEGPAVHIPTASTAQSWDVGGNARSGGERPFHHTIGCVAAESDREMASSNMPPLGPVIIAPPLGLELVPRPEY